MCLVFALALGIPQDPRGKPIATHFDINTPFDEEISIEEDEDYSIEEDEDYSIEEDDFQDMNMPAFGVPDEDGNYRVDDMMMTEEQFRSMFGPED